MSDYKKENFKSSYEKMFESPRMDPITESSGRTSDGKKYNSYVCPTCGNSVSRGNNRYTCSACKQRLRWPGIDYTEYDARNEEKRKLRESRERGEIENGD